VVTEHTLHQTLSSIRDPDKAALQLVELAIRGGGPDNITCIVADVVDSATATRAPSEISVVAGAVSQQGGGQMPRADTPATRAHLLTQPPRPSGGMLDGRGRRGRDPDPIDGEQEHTSRRWPIVTTILVVLVLVIVGGGLAAWSYTQRQYYVGENSGQVAIFRGVNQKLAGISMSSVYKRTGIPIGQVTTDDRQQIASTITASSLSDADKIVTSIRAGATTCQQDFLAQQKYQTAEKTYSQQLSAYQTQKRKHGAAKAGHAPTPPAQPASMPLNCPQLSGQSAAQGTSPTPGSTSTTGATSPPPTTPPSGGTSTSPGHGPTP
jgi:hypothetical protein